MPASGGAPAARARPTRRRDLGAAGRTQPRQGVPGQLRQSALARVVDAPPFREEGVDRPAPAGSGSHPLGALEELLQGEHFRRTRLHEPSNEGPGRAIFCQHGAERTGRVRQAGGSARGPQLLITR